MKTPAVRSAICLAGIIAIALLAVLPSARATYLHGAEIWRGWQNRLLLSPSFWIWAWASWTAVIIPAGMLSRALPFLGVEDEDFAQLAKTLAAFTVIAMGAAVFWQFLAWGAQPLLSTGEIRWIPFWPWPEMRFTPYLLGVIPVLRKGHCHDASVVLTSFQINAGTQSRSSTNNRSIRPTEPDYPKDNPTRRGTSRRRKTPSMEITQEQLKAQLMESSDAFRRLVEQHAEYKKRVEFLEHKSHPSTDEIEEEARLKKLKLHLKDQMAQMLESYKHQLQHV